MQVTRSVAHEKADYYAAILDEFKGRSNSLSSSAHQRLLLGLLADPTREKVAKESSALLKAIQREESSQFSCSSSYQLRPQRPYAPSQPLCYRCSLPGHFVRAYLLGFLALFFNCKFRVPLLKKAEGQNIIYYKPEQLEVCFMSHLLTHI